MWSSYSKECAASTSALHSAHIPYRIVGGLAVFIHVFEREPIKARLTSDVDRYRHVAGEDMLLDPDEPSAIPRFNWFVCSPCQPLSPRVPRKAP